MFLLYRTNLIQEQLLAAQEGCGPVHNELLLLKRVGPFTFSGFGPTGIVVRFGLTTQSLKWFCHVLLTPAVCTAISFPWSISCLWTGNSLEEMFCLRRTPHVPDSSVTYSGYVNHLFPILASAPRNKRWDCFCKDFYPMFS